MVQKSPKDSTSGDHELHKNVKVIQITNAAKIKITRFSFSSRSFFLSLSSCDVLNEITASQWQMTYKELEQSSLITQK